MKAASFDYMRADSVAEVCAALAGAGGEGRIIAGGQTLVPLMAMRMARPTLLVDINRIEGLVGIAGEDDRVVIGSCTRQADALASATVQDRLPLLARALRFVGHSQTRNRGTVGGSLANADPSAEIPLVAVLLDATMTAEGGAGSHSINASDFFESAMMTALADDECLTEIAFPTWHGVRTGCSFHEVSIRDSDFALAAAAAQVTLDDHGSCERIHVAVGGASPCPLRAGQVEDALCGTELADKQVQDAVAALGDVLEPSSDVHADADYRRRVACVMAARAIASARDDALEAAP